MRVASSRPSALGVITSGRTDTSYNRGRMPQAAIVNASNSKSPKQATRST